MAYNYTSINSIMEELLENPLLSDLSQKQVVLHLINFYRIVGVPNFFINKAEPLVIENYRVILPFDYYEVDKILTENGANIGLATSIAHFDPVLRNKSPKYVIQNGYINCNFESGNIKLLYQAIPLDDNDLPMVIENSNFSRAFIDFVTVNRYRRLFDMGKISHQVYHNAKQEYAWSVGSCETEFQRLNLPAMQNFMKVIKSNNTTDFYGNNLNDLGYNG